jgi:hypothetical protein
VVFENSAPSPVIRKVGVSAVTVFAVGVKLVEKT